MRDETKMILSEADAKTLMQAHPQAVNDLLGQAIPNVIGVGAGIKWTNGEPTGEPALVVLVTHKVPTDYLGASALIPSTVSSIKTDVLAIGHLFATGDDDPPMDDGDDDPPMDDGDDDPPMDDGDDDPPMDDGDDDPPMDDGDDDPPMDDGDDDPPMDDQARRRRAARKRALKKKRLAAQKLKAKVRKHRARPIKGGLSVGHRNVGAGTIGACVYDLFLDSYGRPEKYYILSNNHILANCNQGRPGDSIVQPGRSDGGLLPRDRVGRLARYVPIQFAPEIPLAAQNNLVDAAIATVPYRLVDNGIKWIGELRGWMPKSAVKVGTVVKKSGRTTDFTTGRITVVNATIDVQYHIGKVARFNDQILLTKMSTSGDSGALITTTDNVAVGMLFASSSLVSVANQIEHVRSLLRVEIA